MHENLKAYLDGQLSGEQAKLVEEALQRDSNLRKEFDQLRRISSTLREAAVAPAVFGLDKTIDALQRQKAMKKPSFMRFVPAAAVIATCALALVLIGHFNGGQAQFNDESPMPASKPITPSGAATSTPVAAVGAARVGVGTSPVARPNPNVIDDSNYVAAKGAAFAADSQAAGRSELQQSTTMAKKAVPGKQIVKTGSVDLSVTDGKSVMDAATQLANRAGGLVESSNLTGDAERGMTGDLSLRVPVAQFEDTMSGLQKLGKVTNISRNGKDVTSTVVDNAARLQTMRNQEQAYQKILTGAKHIDDVLAVKDRLDEVQQGIASLAAEQQTLRKEAAMSTISVTITQPAQKKAAGVVKDDWLDSTWTGAWAMLSFAGRKITEALIYLIVFCPVWIPMVVLANLLTKRMRQPA